jgi:hypothetical protein
MPSTRERPRPCYVISKSGERLKTVLKAAVATLCFAGIHSLLAARGTKKLAASVVGEKRCHGTYRLFYVGQSLASFIALLTYTGALPRHILYRAKGPARLLMRAGQLASVVAVYWGAHQTGIARLTGVTNYRAWRRGESIPPGPAAQGPEIGLDGELLVSGLFLRSRHPLNLVPLALFWLTPDMSTRRLAFNVVSTVYLVVGSRHEELRLLQAYPQLYPAYKHSGVPFYVPTLKARHHIRHGSDRTPSRIDQRY